MNEPQVPKPNETATDEELRTHAAFLFNLIEAQITRADTKAGLVVAADSFFITLTVFLTRRGAILLLFDPVAPPIERILSILYILVFAAVFCSMFYGLLATRPSLTKKGTGGTLFFFGRIAQHDYSEFMDLFSKQSTSDHHASLLTEVHNTSRIANAKFARVRYSIDFLILALILWAVIVFLHAVSFE